VNVLYVPMPAIREPWYEDFLSAIDSKHDVALFDPKQPVCPQFEGVDVVVDLGGSGATHERIDGAVAAGVKLWQISGTGMDHVDLQYFFDKGLPVANTPGQFSGAAMAEHALFFMLFFAKMYRKSLDHLDRGIFFLPVTEELTYCTLGLIGFGNSGRELARRAAPFGMRLLAVDPVKPSQDVIEECGVEFCGGPDEIDHVLAEADYVSVHTPLNEDTHHLIGAREFKVMKSTAVLINVARGAIVDEAALVEALRSGEIGGAGIDVFSEEPLPPDYPLLHLDNAVVTPHVGGGSRGTSIRRGQACATNVDRIAAGKGPLYLITSMS